MNKYQNALNWFKDHTCEEGLIECIDCDINGCCDYQKKNINERYVLLQELIDKVTPTKPYYKDPDEPLCPYCHNPICEPEEHCAICDQRIDWSSKMIDPERKIKINGHDIEEYLWRGELLVYIDGLLFDGTYAEAQRKCWEER